MKPHVLITDEIHDDGIFILDQAGFDVTLGYRYSNDDIYFTIDRVDALIVRTETNVDERLIGRGVNGRLKVIGRAGVGLDNIDTEAAQRWGVKVYNTPNANAQSAAEHTIGMMIALARHIPQATGGTRQGRWERSRFMGTELNGKTLAIIGVGRVGSRVAKIAEAIGMTTYGFDLMPSECSHIYRWGNSIEETVIHADFVTVHVPYNETTENLINADLIFTMKRGVHIINCARGPLVNQEDLIYALDDGHVMGYACDVFEHEPVKDPHHPFYSRRNCIVTPHIGAMTYEAQKRVGVEIGTKIRDYLQNGKVDK